MIPSIHCPTCGGKLDSDVQTCPSCGETGLEVTAIARSGGLLAGATHRRASWLLLLLLALGALAFAFGSSALQHAKERGERAANVSLGHLKTIKPYELKFLHDRIRSGTLRLENEKHQAWVDPSLWNSLPAGFQERLTVILAEHFETRSHRSDRWAEIYDQLSEQKLASYDERRGFRFD